MIRDADLDDTDALARLFDAYRQFCGRDGDIERARQFVLARRTGVGAALLAHAEAHARATGASRLSLSTAHTNAVAQRLYERNGWVLDTEFRHYHRVVA